MVGTLFSLLGAEENEFFSGEMIGNFGGYSKEGFDDSFYIIFDEVGISLLFDLNDDDKYYVNSVFIENSGLSKWSFAEFLGFNISFELARDQIRDVLGVQTQESIWGKNTLLGPVSPWDKFRVNEFYIHFQPSRAG